ncbi:MAG: polysaccharide deacetylase family protein [Ferruginibacter sp.]
MSSLKKIYYKGASLLPSGLFRSGGPQRLLLPYHHTVSNNTLEHIAHLYAYKNEKQFISDLDFLLKHYTPATADDIYTAVKNNHPFQKGSFLLSFDDGFREIYDVIAPILEKKGVPAIFFVNPSFIDNRKLFYRCKISILAGQLKRNPSLLPAFATALNTTVADSNEIIEMLKKVNQNNTAVLDTIAATIGYSFDEFLRTQLPFASAEQLINLHKRGFTIGAHSMDHPYYALLDEQDQVDQTIRSVHYVKELLRTDTCHFSFPHSDAVVSQKVIGQINEQMNGLLFGIQNQKAELHNNILHRFNAERPETSAAELVKGQLLLNRIQQAAGKNSVKRN